MAQRREHGDGTVYQDKHGNWYAELTVGYKVVNRNGKMVRQRQRKKVRCATEKLAGKELKRLQAAQLHGLQVTSQRLTVAQFLQQWLQVRKPTLRRSSYGLYRWICEDQLIPALGHLSLIKLSKEDIEVCMEACTQAGYGVTTIRQVRTVLRIALNYAVEQELLLRNVVALTTAPRAVRRPVTTFTPEQAHTFIAAVRGDRLEALYMLILLTGVRQGEALALRWQDVDLDRAILHVRGTLQRDDGGALVIEEPKNRPKPPHDLPARRRRCSVACPSATPAAGMPGAQHGLAWAGVGVHAEKRTSAGTRYCLCAAPAAHGYGRPATDQLP